MPAPFRITALSALLLSPVAFAEDLDQRLAHTEARLAALEQQNSVAERFQINGFITYGMQRTNTIRGLVADPNNPGVVLADQPIDFAGVGTDWNLSDLSRAGIRISADINERTSAVVQLLARGDEEYNAQVQWAYIAYELTPSLTWRAGRLVLPTYMHSQYTQAGYAYPWVALPTQVYGTLPVDTMEGMDLTWGFTTGAIGHSLNVTWGSTDLSTNTGRYIVRNQAGANLTSHMGNLSTRVSYSMGQTTLALPDLSVLPDPGPNLAPFSLDDDYGYFASVGAQYDDGQWLLMAELVQLGVNTPNNWFPTQTAGYVMAGHRFGRLLPHLTWTTVDSKSEADCGATPECFGLAADNAVRSKSWTFGSRYDLAPGIALKAEASRYYDFSDDNTVNAAQFSGRPTTSNPTVFRLAVDAAF
jgi:hypothetical protein